MNTHDEFPWRSQLRPLNTPVEPTRDLWPAIAARIAQVPSASRRRDWRRGFAAIAATIVIASAAGLTAYRLGRRDEATPLLHHQAAATSADVDRAAPRTALDWAVPADPKLAVVARDLDQASADLVAALEARPDAVFLVSMLNRTQAQRMRLLRQAAISG
jgi:hypothetical protein